MYWFCAFSVAASARRSVSLTVTSSSASDFCEGGDRDRRERERVSQAVCSVVDGWAVVDGGQSTFADGNLRKQCQGVDKRESEVRVPDEQERRVPNELALRRLAERVRLLQRAE